VYFLLDLVDELDLSAILIPAQAKDPRGEKGVDPLMMLMLYAYCVGIISSRKIDAIKGLFIQILRLCKKAGMVSLGHVALDGAKVQANASKLKAMSHES
jgi:transposase